MILVFHPLAERELAEAGQFYEEAAPGLGAEFLDELERLAALIAAYPDAGVGNPRDVRVIHARRFPYSLVYEVRDTTVLVLAIAHQRRRPRHWGDRRD